MIVIIIIIIIIITIILYSLCLIENHKLLLSYKLTVTLTWNVHQSNSQDMQMTFAIKSAFSNSTLALYRCALHNEASFVVYERVDILILARTVYHYISD